MADAKITALTALTSADGADLLAIVDDVAGTPITKKITLTNILAWIAAQAITFLNTITHTPATNVVALKVNPSGSQAANLVEVTSDGTNVRFRLDAAGRIGSRGLVVGPGAESGALTYDVFTVKHILHSPSQPSGFIRLAANVPLGWNASNDDPNGSASDTVWERAATNAFKATDGGAGFSQVRMQSLGVNNSAAGSTPGTVTKKIEVFDASGVSLGFVAVYDAIT